MTRKCRSFAMQIVRSALFLAAMCIPTAAQSATVPADFAAKVDAIVQRELERQRVPGIEVGIAVDGAVVLQRGYGTRDVRQSLPVDDRTVFALGSITKTFTAAAVMKLVAEHRLDLDAPLQTYVPDAPHARELTVRSLVTQTSGLADYVDAHDGLAVATQTDVLPAKLVASISEEALGFVPGTHFAYSNTNYLLLTAVVERASGLAFSDYLRRGIVEPLHLSSLSYGRPESGSDVAVGYTRAFPAPVWSAAFSRGAGALWGSVADLLLLDEAFFGGRFLSTETVRTMTSKQPLRDGVLSEYAFGWFVSELGGHKQLWHNGGVPGFSARNAVFPDDRLAVVVLGNSSTFDEEPIVRGVLGLIDPASTLRESPEPPAPVDDPAVTALARSVLASVQSGTIDRTAYTAEANAAFTDAVIRSVGVQLAPLGTPSGMALLYRGYTGNLEQFVYRLSFGRLAVLERLDLDPSRKIAGLLFRPAQDAP